MIFSEMPYTRIDMEKAKEDVKVLIGEFKQCKSGEEQFAVHQKYYKLTEHISSMITLAHIRHDINMKDEFYDGEQTYYDNEVPAYNQLLVEYGKSLFHSQYRDILEEKIGKVAFKNMELQMKANDEKLVPLKQEENRLTNRYMKLIASAEIPFDGGVYNLSLMNPFLTSEDRDTRKRAYEAVGKYFSEVTEEIDEIYDQLVKNRTQQAKLLGYENFVELGYYRMQRNCYDKKMVENFRKQVKEIFVPFVQTLVQKKRERLELDKLAYYDENTFFQNGNPKPIGTPDEILKEGQKMYAELSPETKEFYDFMYENQLFDVLGRKTKRAGGYMTYLPDFKSPFIFANFNGTSGDIDVITHECGHAFQGFVTREDEVPEHNEIGMETAEIHSMSMEYFTDKWMDRFFGERADDYRKMHVEDGCCFVPYGCMVDEFQHIVYENPDMTPLQRKEAWRKLEKEYKPHLDYSGNPFFEMGGYWQRQHHIFDLPFYYIDYCLATICALQFKIKMDENYEKAWEDYLKLCKLSAQDFYTNLLAKVDLKSPFENGTIEWIVEKMKTIIKEC